MSNWYYEIDGERKGPVGELQLKELMDSGVIKPETVIYEIGIMKPVKAIESDFYKNGFGPSVWYLPGISFVLGIISIYWVSIRFPFLQDSVTSNVNISFIVSDFFMGLMGLVSGVFTLIAIKKGKIKGYTTYTIIGTLLSGISVIMLIVLYVIHS